MINDLIDECKKLLEDAEQAEKSVVERADPTQLRIAVRRLGLFIEHLTQVKAAGKVDADQPKRRGRPPKAKAGE